MARRSSYRLGRRLKASRRDRLDYITYLQSGGNPSFGGKPEIPGRISMRFGLGGLMEASIGVGANFAALMQGGGELRANIYPPVTLRATFELGGEFGANLNSNVLITANSELGGQLSLNLDVVPRQFIGAIYEGGGSLAANIRAYTRQELSAVVALGGELSVNTAIRQVLSASTALGGAFSLNIFPPVVVRAAFALGGAFGLNLITPKPLSATSDLGGTMTANIAQVIDGVLINRMLMAAGGAGGGRGGSGVSGGGGGGGGVIEINEPFTIPSGEHELTVGLGGAQGVSGGFSEFLEHLAIGGGFGAGSNGVNGGNGGSGGGGRGAGSGSAGGTGTPGQGNNGGTGYSSLNPGGAGGGGAGAIGANGRNFLGGNGGNGVLSDITGVDEYYGGGGGGGGASSGQAGGTGGLGGGGKGSNGGVNNAGPGAPNTGGGGGGAAAGTNRPSGIGGSGVLILRYDGSSPKLSGGTWFVDGDEIVHTFTVSQTIQTLGDPINISAAFDGGGEMAADVELRAPSANLIGVGAPTGSNSSITLIPPQGVQPGDLLLAFVHTSGFAIPVVDGWTNVDTVSVGTSETGTLIGVLTRVAENGDPTFWVASTPQPYARAIVSVFRNAMIEVVGDTAYTTSGTHINFTSSEFDVGDIVLTGFSIRGVYTDYTVNVSPNFNNEDYLQDNLAQNTILSAGWGIGYASVSDTYAPFSFTIETAQQMRVGMAVKVSYNPP